MTTEKETDWEAFRETVVQAQHRLRTKMADVDRLVSSLRGDSLPTPERLDAARRAATVAREDIAGMLDIVESASRLSTTLRDLTSARDFALASSADAAKKLVAMTVAARAAKHVLARLLTITGRATPAGPSLLVHAAEFNAVARGADAAMAALHVDDKLVDHIAALVNAAIDEDGSPLLCQWPGCSAGHSSDHVFECPFAAPRDPAA